MSDVLSPLHSHPIEACQICASPNLRSAVFLGYVPPVNTMLPVESTPDAELRFPLELLRCDDCSSCRSGIRSTRRICSRTVIPT